MHIGTVAFAAVVIHLSASCALGHVGGWVYPIYEVPSQDLPDLHDGTFEDWLDIVPGPSFAPVDFVSIANPRGGPDDLTMQGYLLWHARSQRLYIGFQRIDDVAVDWYDGADPDRFIWYDSIAFALDGDHSGGEFCTGFETYAEVLSQSGFQAQRYHSMVTTQGDGFLQCWCGPRNGWAAAPPYADIGGHTEGGGPVISSWEMYVTAWDGLRREGPETSTRTALVPGLIVGFNVMVYDHDIGTAKIEEVYQLPGDGDIWSADRFVDAVLIPCAESDCSGGPENAAVSTDSWARIKASFR